MKLYEAIEKMILFYQGNQHDINHFLKVYAYAGMIGRAENLDDDTLEILELAAVVHDIACPLCRKKYGNTKGSYQEAESEELLRNFFEGSMLEEEKRERIIYLVCHHHTYTNVEGTDHRILLEADFLVNAEEGSVSREVIEKMYENVYRTTTGKRVLRELYLMEKRE